MLAWIAGGFFGWRSIWLVFAIVIVCTWTHSFALFLSLALCFSTFRIVVCVCVWFFFCVVVARIFCKMFCISLGNARSFIPFPLSFAWIFGEKKTPSIDTQNAYTIILLIRVYAFAMVIQKALFAFHSHIHTFSPLGDSTEISTLRFFCFFFSMCCFLLRLFSQWFGLVFYTFERFFFALYANAMA